MTAITITDLSNAKLDVDHIAAIATSVELTATDRLGHTKNTLAAAIDSIKSFTDRGAWAAATVYAGKDLVSNGGTWYVCVVAHTSSAAFATDTASKWRVYQGVIASDLAAPSCTSQIGTITTGTGAIPRTLAAKVNDVTSILDFAPGGDYDPVALTGTNDIYALSDLMARGPTNQVVKFPAIAGKLNNYLLSYPSGYTIPFGSMVLDVDPGATLYLAGVVLSCEFVRPTKIVYVGLPSGEFYLQQNGANPAQKEVHKDRWMNSADALAPTVRMLTPNADLRGMKMIWPGTLAEGGGDFSTMGSTYVTLDTTKATISTAVGDSSLHNAVRRIMAGDEIGSNATIVSGTPRLCAFVRTTRGFSGSYLDIQACSSFEKVVGSALVETVVTPVGMGNHQSYSPIGSVIAIRLLTAYKFQVLVNGYVVLEKTMTDPVQEAGFGAYVSGASNVTWQDWYLAKGRANNAARLVGLFIIGDSITADKSGSWPRQCRAALEGSFGARVTQYNNQAIGGQDSSAQLAVLTASGVPAGTTHTVIQIGTNDIQSLASVATMTSNVATMLNMLEAAGSKIVVGLPPLWLMQSITGARGQAATNYAAGTPYRMALLALCAARNIPVVDSLPLYGPIIGQFLNPLLVPNLTSRASMVFDNIHPDTYMSKLMGYEYAKHILGQMVSLGTNEATWATVPSQWETVAPWTVAAGETPQYSVSADGMSQFRAGYTMAGATKTDGFMFQVLGRIMFPPKPHRFDVYTNIGERGLGVIGTDGLIKIYGISAITGATLYVDTGRYETAF